MQPRWKKLAIIAIVVLVILLGLGIGTKAYGDYSTKHTASAFIADILANNSSQSYDQFTPDAQKNTSKDVWKAQVKQWSSFFKGREYTYQSVTKSNGALLVDYRINGSDGAYTFEVTLTGSGFNYKVDAFTSSLN